MEVRECDVSGLTLSMLGHEECLSDQSVCPLEHLGTLPLGWCALKGAYCASVSLIFSTEPDDGQ